MRHLPLFLGALVACEPPPAIEVEPALLPPTIEILFPDRNIGTIPADDCDGNLTLLVVVDVENLDLQSPYEDDVELVEGEGYWHGFFQSDSTNFTASFSNTVEISIAGPIDFTGGPVLEALHVALQDNFHNEIDGGANTVEFSLIPPDGVVCP